MAMGGEEDDWTAFSANSDREWTQFSESCSDIEQSTLELCFPLAVSVSATLPQEEELLALNVE